MSVLSETNKTFTLKNNFKFRFQKLLKSDIEQCTKTMFAESS